VRDRFTTRSARRDLLGRQLPSAEILMHTRLQRVHPFHRGAQELNPIAMTEVCEKLLEQRGIFLRHSEIRTT
jgi:hypothetical protein|tara:strand:+ start:2205 stop:2420 length:216 start_codon:yes stop_codon:yes gene_type:complete